MTSKFVPHVGTWISTPLGSVELVPTSASHIHVNAGSNGKNDITVNGVAYSLSMHLQVVDGKVSLLPNELSGRTYDALYASRRHYNGPRGWDASPAARKKIEATLLPVIQKWVDVDPATMTSAEAIDHNNRIERIETEIAKLEAEIAEKRTELEGHRAALLALKPEGA